MNRASPVVLLVSLLLLGTSVVRAEQAAGLEPIGELVPSHYDFGLPSWAPAPLEPAANPTTPAKVDLGRHLFFDTRLSLDRSMSCASCHEQERAFTDGRAVSHGVTGDTTPRNAMSLANVGYAPVLTWANPLLNSLERQALVPLIGQEPVELGLAGIDKEVMQQIGRASCRERV